MTTTQVKGSDLASRGTSAKPVRTDGTGLIDIDPWLEPYADRLRQRYATFSTGSIARGHRRAARAGEPRGTTTSASTAASWGKPGVWYREWAPAALQLRLDR